MKNVNKLVKFYFSLGLKQEEILTFLLIRHNINLSRRTLKRILNHAGLFRRKHFTNLQTVISFLQEKVQKSGQLHGYRWMHLKCLQKGFVVKQNTVRLALQILDPYGVEIRKRKRLRRRQYFNKGPNFVWHLDSYDKLKPYGIAINGCIDEYSRYVLWLKAGRTSSNPRVIGGYYIETVSTLNGCPRIVRSDMGTENGHVKKMQKFLKEENSESNSVSFIYGRSSANQRIESWWCILRKHHAQFFMNLFQKLKDDAYFDGTFLDKSLIQFCFMDIIQTELDTIVQEWNCHSISSSKNSISPAGKPVVMYELPEAYGAENCIVDIKDTDHIEVCKEECRFLRHPCDKDMYQLCEIIMEEKEMERLNDAIDAVNLYV